MSPRVAVSAGLLVMAAMGAYPPWVLTYNAVRPHDRLVSQPLSAPDGYAWLSSPNVRMGRTYADEMVRGFGHCVDVRRLLLQWLCTAFAAGAVAVALMRCKAVTGASQAPRVEQLRRMRAGEAFLK